MGAKRSWAVVGGGISGLRVAQRLAEAGHAVTVYEAGTRIGGLAAAWEVGGVFWDKHYHVTLLSDAHTRGMLSDLGLEADARWVETRTGFFAAGRLHPMSNSIDYLRLPALSPLDKARLAATIIYGARVEDWRKLEQVSVEAWLRKLSGNRTFERLWLPLLRAKLGASYTQSSAAFIWATIRRLYAARRSGLKKEMFGYVRGGYARVFERYAEHLAELGVELRTACPVAGVRRDGGGWQVTLSEERVERHDRVVMTCTPRTMARLCPDLGAAERASLERIAYQGVVCASLLLERPLEGNYLTYLLDADLPFTALVEMTSLVDPAELGGRSLVYLPRYVASDDPLFEESDEDLRARFVAGLERVSARFRPSDVLAFRVARTREVFPLPVIDYSLGAPPVSTSLPGLSYIGSSQIVNGTLNVNDTLDCAERGVRELLASEAPA